MENLLSLINTDIKEKRDTVPTFNSGDTVNIHVKISEGNKERIQQFQGVVIQIRNTGSAGETITVRKVSSGIGVERIFLTLSPSIDKIEVIRRGKVRRARLFYLREAKGKKAKIKEKIVKTTKKVKTV